MTSLMDIIQYEVMHHFAYQRFKYLQATALVCYKIREVSQSKAVPEVKQCHDVWSKIQLPEEKG